MRGEDLEDGSAESSGCAAEGTGGTGFRRRAARDGERLDREAVAEVFAFAGAYENDPRWRAGVVEMRQDPPGSPRVGTKTCEVMRVFGRRQVTVAKVVGYDPDERTAFESVEGPIPVRGYRAFEASEEGTRFTYELSAELSPLYRLLYPILAPSLRRQVSGDLQRLKALLERE